MTYNPYVEFLTDEELPPGRLHSRRRLRAFADELRENPGLWAKYPGGSTGSPGTTVWRINHERTGSLSCDEFEAIERKGEIYVRYQPKESHG